MKMMERKARSGLIVLIMLNVFMIIIEPKTAQTGFAYISGSNNELGTLDLSTGAFKQTGILSLSNGGILYALGTGNSGSLTGVDNSGEAYLINAITGSTSDQGFSGTTPVGGGGANSILYTYDANSQKLSSLNFTNGTLTPLGTYGFAGIGLVVAGLNGHVYVAAITSSGTDDLYDINTATKIATDLGSTGYSNLYSGVYSEGKIYGFDGSGAIVTLSATTGLATFVSNYSLPGGDSIYAAAAFPAASVPEPPSLTMLGLGLFGILGFTIRKRYECK